MHPPHGINTPHHRPTIICQWRDWTARSFVHWMCNHHYECLIIQRVWCWCLENLNRDWIYGGCVSSSSCVGSSRPLSIITTSIRKRRFRSVELDNPDVYCGHLRGSSTKVKYCDNKSPAPTQCSRLRPNFHLEASTKREYWFSFSLCNASSTSTVK